MPTFDWNPRGSPKNRCHQPTCILIRPLLLVRADALEDQRATVFWGQRDRRSVSPLCFMFSWTECRTWLFEFQAGPSNFPPVFFSNRAQPADRSQAEGLHDRAPHGLFWQPVRAPCLALSYFKIRSLSSFFGGPPGPHANRPLGTLPYQPATYELGPTQEPWRALLCIRQALVGCPDCSLKESRATHSLG